MPDIEKFNPQLAKDLEDYLFENTDTKVLGILKFFEDKRFLTIKQLRTLHKIIDEWKRSKLNQWLENPTKK